ncbi:MAG: hypothetical protein JWO38_7824 [Gemmataceae bacterium]|nr:hypothetical protein [Gemmataceae bacterium]
MTYAATAGWLRGRLWIGWPVGAVAWVVWFGSLAYGGWATHRPVDAEGTPVGVDHVAFYSAARLIRDGQPARMYDYSFLSSYQGSLLGWDWEMLVAYRNPPFYALLYLPTAGLPFVASLLVWTAIGLGLLTAAVWWLRPERPARTLAWSLTFYPVFAAVSFGQNSLLSLGVFAGIYRLLAGGRPFTAGLVSGLLWYKPQLLLGLFVWWGLAPRRNAMCWAGLAVTGMVLAAVSWLVLPDASWAFVETLRSNVGYSGERGWNKQSPRAFWTLLFPEADTGIVWSLTAACALAGIAAAWRVARRTGAPLAVMFPVAVFLSLWLSPHTLVYEWALLVPAAVVLWERHPARRDAWLCLFAIAWVVLAVSTPLAKVQIDYVQPPAVIQVAVPVMAAVGLLVMRELARADRTG